ncbi:Sec63 [Tulasnella sp. 424]|nr:Sec63 [Tulasnella sp. 424]
MYYPNDDVDVFQDNHGAQNNTYNDAIIYDGFAASDPYSDAHPGYSSPSPHYTNQASRRTAIMGSSAAGRLDYAPTSGYGSVNDSLASSSSWQPQSHNTRYQTGGAIQRADPQIALRPSSSSRPQNPHPLKKAGGIRLVPVSTLPDMYRSVFKFGLFNAVQSQCFDTVMNTSQNMVISAPTGSGKTVIFELAIIRTLLNETNHAKCVYMAPTKALCSERFNDWTNKFQPLGIKCCELTGDTVDTSRKAWKEAKDATIIVTTPEKWDSLTRNWRDHQDILATMQLFLVDEVHILNETRGSTLEVCISRMKTRGTAVRFILLSATAPNIEDIASWVGSHSDASSDRSQSRSAMVFKFGEEYRPCKIARHVYSYAPKNQNAFQFSKMLDFRLFDLLQRHACGKPVLIFCPTRKGVSATAEQLAKEFKKCVEEKRKLPWAHPGRVNGRFHDSQLNTLLASGIGVHHAGLSIEDRKLAEELYLTGQIRTLVATSTLAVGVNLPAHTVVIKGTQMWAGTAWTEYCDLDVMQMLGRAGRPQFDKEGLAIIMCSSDKDQHYRALTSGTTTIESCLHRNLTEHLNSEVGLGTITSLETAKSWLHNSFLFQRLRRNPSHYALGKDQNQTWEQRLDDLVAESINSLRDADLVTTTQDGMGQISALAATEFGEIMSRMRLILQLPEKVTMRDMVYNALKDHNDIRMTVKKIEKPGDKIMVLIQAVLGGISLNSKEYKTTESQPVLEAMAMVDTAIAKRNASHVKFGLELVRSLSAKAWDDRPIVLRQIPQIGEKSIKVLASAGIGTIAALRVQDPHRLELLLNRKPPFGRDILEEVSALPKYRLKITEESLTHSGGAESVVASLAIEVGLDAPLTIPKGKKVLNAGFACILTVTSDMEFIDFRRVSVRALEQPRSFTVVARLDKPSQAIDVIVGSEQNAGLTVTQQYKPVVSPRNYPTMKTRPKTELEAELEGLRDIDPSVWTVTDEEMMDLTAGTQEDVAPSVPTQSSVVEVTQLPNGRFACSHTCKDKQNCRHLCCREGLVKPPKSSKSTTLPKSTNEPQQQATASSFTRKTSVAPTPSKKPKARADIVDKTMKNLDKLQGSSNVGLKMPEGGRISLSNRSNEKKGSVTQPPWISRAGFSPKYAALESPKRMGDEDDNELPDISETASPVVKRKEIAASPASTDYSDGLFNELLAKADLESLSRPPERTTTKSRKERKRSPRVEDDVVLVDDSEIQPPPSKKARTSQGTTAASSSRTAFSERNGRTVPLPSTSTTSRMSTIPAVSQTPSVKNRRPLFHPPSSSPTTQPRPPALMPINDVEMADPLLHEDTENSAVPRGLDEFGLDADLFEMEDDPLAGEIDDIVEDGSRSSKGGSNTDANTPGAFCGPHLGASAPSIARPPTQEPGFTSLGRWGPEPGRTGSFSYRTEATKANSSINALQCEEQVHPKAITSTVSTRGIDKAPGIAKADSVAARLEDGAAAEGKEIAPGVERTGCDAMDDFLDWMYNSGEVEIVD